jgi:hypothetical protein
MESGDKEEMEDSTVEADAGSVEPAKKRGGRPQGCRNNYTAASTDDPADVEVTDVKARHRRSARGRPVYTPTFLSASWKGMDDRMVQYAGRSNTRNEKKLKIRSTRSRSSRSR